jgi:RHS repeat-associated protein
MTTISSIKQTALQTALRFVFAAFCLFISFASNAQTTVTYFHNDPSGSPMIATDAAGNVVWKESYKPYGEKLRNEPTSRDGKNKIGYAGSPFDASTGLSYMGARYYDPVIGRFMGIDPVGFQENNIHSFNRYTYANNNPYKYIDSDGRMAFIPWLVAAAEAALVRAGIFVATKTPQIVTAAEIGAQVATGAAGGGVLVAEGLAAKGAAALGREIGIVREANIIKGNVTLSGQVTRAEMDSIGKTWVGSGHRPISDGSGLVSADGLRVYRAPTLKPKSSYATTGVQANLEQKLAPGTQPFSNAHVNVEP